MEVRYLGSTKATRMIVLSLGNKFGCQHCRKMTIGDKIAELATNGNAAALEECKKYPQLFEIKD